MYVCKTKEINEADISDINDATMLTPILDFLDAVQDNYRDEDADLPENWYGSLFWRIREEENAV